MEEKVQEGDKCEHKKCCCCKGMLCLSIVIFFLLGGIIGYLIGHRCHCRKSWGMMNRPPCGMMQSIPETAPALPKH